VKTLDSGTPRQAGVEIWGAGKRRLGARVGRSEDTGGSNDRDEKWSSTLPPVKIKASCGRGCTVVGGRETTGKKPGKWQEIRERKIGGKIKAVLRNRAPLAHFTDENLEGRAGKNHWDPRRLEERGLPREWYVK